MASHKQSKHRSPAGLPGLFTRKSHFDYRTRLALASSSCHVLLERTVQRG